MDGNGPVNSRYFEGITLNWADCLLRSLLHSHLVHARLKKQTRSTAVLLRVERSMLSVHCPMDGFVLF